MAKHTRAETVDYVAKILKSNAKTPYADVVKEGRKAGHHVYPLIMGLAKTKLGIGGKRRAKRGRKGRKPGRPPAAGRPARGAARGITSDLVRSIERMHTDAAAMRAALRDIARLAARF
jgi:hypothetical protein